jgi:hypothetical protein
MRYDDEVTIEPAEPTLSEEYDLPTTSEQNQGFEILPLDPVIYGKKRKKIPTNFHSIQNSITFSDLDSHR